MPIQLDKILENIVKERILHPQHVGASKNDVDEAWSRVGRNNKLSVHEARSIFKVLQKKYEQEKIKENSSWKLFGLMQIIHEPNEPKPVPQPTKKEKESNEEIEEYEMLDVHEPEEEDVELTEEGNDGDSPSKSGHNSTGSPDKEDKIVIKGIPLNKIRPELLQQNDEKKLLNIGARPVVATPTIQKKTSITVKKTANNSSNKKPGGVTDGSVVKASQQNNKIRLPEIVKRKLNEDLLSSQNKKAALSEKIGTITTTTTSAQLNQMKKERETGVYTPPPGINIITVPGNVGNGSASGCVGGDATSSTSGGTVATSTSTNGFSSNINDINFSNGGIIFDSTDINGSTTTVVSGNGKIKTENGISSEFINLANFDNSLPPTFFKNLCNSTRHEALGLYVSNIMNRMAPRNAAKLEISILRAILDAQSEELED